MKTMRIALFLVFLLLLACNSDLKVLEGAGPLAVSRHAVINGELSHEPAVVGLHGLTVIDGSLAVYLKPFCTGTLVLPGVVLTAAHCLDVSSSSWFSSPISPSELAIYAGDNPSGDDDGDGWYNISEDGRLFMVQQVVINPSYRKRYIRNDLGMVRLVNAIPDAAIIHPLPPSQAIDTDDVGILDLHLVGFGQTVADDSDSYGVKMHGYVKLSNVLPYNQIEHTYDDSDSDNDNAICFGDSGGPALVQRDGTTFVGGVASYVTSPYCLNTGVHTKVDAYYDGFISDFVAPCWDGVCGQDESCETCPDDCGPCSTCAEDEECEDGDPCTEDSCQDGQCVNEAIDCDDDNACTTDSCDPATGCVNEAIDCDDDNACTTDSCDPATGCVNQAKSCDDGNACTSDGCDPATGECVSSPVSCDDGDLCTTDSCNSASGCVFSPKSCPADENACTAESCDPATGGCVSSPVNCDDGDLCTTDSCDPATGCVSEARSCDDDNACTTDSCDPATGCVNEAKDCDDGSACTADSCDPGTGECVNEKISCDDDNACTTDSCDATYGCRYDVVPDCCGNASCESGSGEDACTCPADCGPAPSTETDCSDGIDNDCDGAIDEEDADCNSSCLPRGSSCSSNEECCSGSCRGWFWKRCR